MLSEFHGLDSQVGVGATGSARLVAKCTCSAQFSQTKALEFSSPTSTTIENGGSHQWDNAGCACGVIRVSGGCRMP
jgi:hypothetical protein